MAVQQLWFYKTEPIYFFSINLSMIFTDHLTTMQRATENLAIADFTWICCNMTLRASNCCQQKFLFLMLCPQIRSTSFCFVRCICLNGKLFILYKLDYKASSCRGKLNYFCLLRQKIEYKYVSSYSFSVWLFTFSPIMDISFYLKCLCCTFPS